MEVRIESGIDDSISSKVQIFYENTGNGIALFEKGKFPRILDSGYDPLLFLTINCSFLVKNDLGGFFSVIEPFVEFNLSKKIFEMEDLKVNELKKALITAGAMSGISVLELAPNDSKREHLDFLKKLGAEASALPVKENSGSLDLQNFSSKANKEFDITFSDSLLHDNSGIEDDAHSNVYRSMELYAVMSNLTKKHGYSIHCHGAYISSLYETFFQFIGFKVIDYFRIGSGNHDFGMVMEKINTKKISKEEFDYLYTEMKKRNPIRFR
ncbi:hypothetical protein HYT53_02770 [Candidatus Woesearchaeota archaeon]|nr:hypothetical protein [Candidatus Woesearchaeota archaeon]